jgi:hypothetical protein
MDEHPVRSPAEATASGWHRLAAPTFATSTYGRTVEFPAGTEIRHVPVLAQGDAIHPDTIRVSAGPPFECEARPRRHMPAYWYVTTSALRFEDEQPDIWPDMDARVAPEVCVANGGHFFGEGIACVGCDLAPEDE